MPKYIEYEGKNVDLALEAAGKELNLPVDKIRYDVVSHGSSGIFGLVGVKKAKIRVLADPGRRHVSKEVKAQARDLVNDAFNIEEKPIAPPAAEPARETEAPRPENIEKAIKTGEEVLKKVTAYISEGATILTENTKDRLLFKIDDGNSALLIGKRGQTLEAMQYLLEKIVNKQCDQRIRVLVDVEGYLETRKTNLKKLASRMADKVKKINKPVTIGQMNAYDRRIVHLHLKENQAVRTQSVGEGYYRKLVIFPKRRSRKKQD